MGCARTLIDTAHHIKGWSRNGGGTVVNIDIPFLPGTDVPVLTLGLKLPIPLDGVTLKHARALLKVAA